ncbi:MAG: LON peptidase substrate-binding domain-containing protein, partial [Deltaproteobacteria bacterium]|nr:LON peptidase substrate-binding domain-containing protein [Deltaproteobacteria bacterium]
MANPEEEREEAKRQRFIGFEEDLSDIQVPDTLPILPLRGVVIFPSAIVPLLISRESSLKVVEQVLAGDRMLGVVAQKNPEEESPTPETLYSRGTAGRVLKMLKYPDGSVRILVQGLRRAEIVEYQQLIPYFKARVHMLSDTQPGTTNTEAIQTHMVNQF